MNQLENGEPFSLELMNVDITMRTGKGGPRWRFHADITEEEALIFANAPLAGMIIEVQGRVTEQQSPEPEKLKGGPLSIEAAQWCHGELQNEYARAIYNTEFIGYPNALNNKYIGFKEMIYHKCGIESRAELDHSPDAAFKWQTLKNDFLVWSENRQS